MSLQSHTLTPNAGSHHRTKRVGRGNGSGHGTTATRGTKGQRARSGGRRGLKRLGMKRIIAALPKHRGFISHRTRPAAILVGSLAAHFAAGSVVSPQNLKDRGMVEKLTAGVKLIAGGSLTMPLTVKGCKVSSGARAQIEAAGGTVV